MQTAAAGTSTITPDLHVSPNGTPSRRAAAAASPRPRPLTLRSSSSVVIIGKEHSADLAVPARPGGWRGSACSKNSRMLEREADATASP